MRQREQARKGLKGERERASMERIEGKRERTKRIEGEREREHKKD